jgi:hypothetical protein
MIGRVSIGRNIHFGMSTGGCAPSGVRRWTSEAGPTMVATCPFDLLRVRCRVRRQKRSTPSGRHKPTLKRTPQVPVDPPNVPLDCLAGPSLLRSEVEAGEVPVAREQRKLAAIVAADVVGYSWRVSVCTVRSDWSQHSRDTAAGAGGVCVAPPRMPWRSRVPSQSRFQFLRTSLVLRLGTMPHLLSVFQLPDKVAHRNRGKRHNLDRAA